MKRLISVVVVFVVVLCFPARAWVNAQGFCEGFDLVAGECAIYPQVSDSPLNWLVWSNQADYIPPSLTPRCVESFIPDEWLTNNGDKDKWKIPLNESLPTEPENPPLPIDKFLLLTTEDFPTRPQDPWFPSRSYIKRIVYAERGTSITFDWFFGTVDYYSDYAEIYLEPVLGGEKYSLFLVDVLGPNGVGARSSTAGWQQEDYMIRDEDFPAGWYWLVIEINDSYDTYFGSFFAVNKLEWRSYCPYEYGDWNYDHRVNFLDYAIETNHPDLLRLEDFGMDGLQGFVDRWLWGVYD